MTLPLLLLLTATISRKCSESFLAKCLFSYFLINNPLVLQNVEIDEDKDHALPMGSHNTVGSPSHSGRHGEHCRHAHTQTHKHIFIQYKHTNTYTLIQYKYVYLQGHRQTPTRPHTQTQKDTNNDPKTHKHTQTYTIHAHGEY